jgi:polyisoprenoid-binding protein YceI
MKKVVTILSIVLATFTAYSQTTEWKYDNSHAKVGFAISHFGISETEGKFTKYDGSVVTSKADFSDAKIDLTIDVTSIDTDDAQRDTHLRSPDFFDAAKYPSITFKSKSLKSSGRNKYTLVGDLTMHGVTREVNLDVLYRGTVTDPYKNTKAGFRINGIVDRTQFGLAWNGKLSTGDLLIGNDVNLDINIELIKKS